MGIDILWPDNRYLENITLINNNINYNKKNT